MICSECKNSELTPEVVESYRYVECGLPTVTLKDITIERCASCGLEYAVIPRMAQLHRVIAEALIMKKDRLMGDEIKYLRKHLGWSSADFAKEMHTNVSQISRWENGRTSMSIANELLLRSLVALGGQITDYKASDAAKEKGARPRTLRLYRDDNVWRKAA